MPLKNYMFPISIGQIDAWKANALSSRPGNDPGWPSGKVQKAASLTAIELLWRKMVSCATSHKINWACPIERPRRDAS